MSYNAKYKVYRVIEAPNLETHTSLGWELVQVFSVTEVMPFVDSVANPHPPPPNHNWTGTVGYGVWPQTIQVQSTLSRKSLRFLMGLTEEKYQTIVSNLERQLEIATGDRKAFEATENRLLKELADAVEDIRKLKDARRIAEGEVYTLKLDKDKAEKLSESLNRDNMELKRRLIGYEEYFKKFPPSSDPIRVVELSNAKEGPVQDGKP